METYTNFIVKINDSIYLSYGMRKEGIPVFIKSNFKLCSVLAYNEPPSKVHVLNAHKDPPFVNSIILLVRVEGYHQPFYIAFGSEDQYEDLKTMINKGANVIDLYYLLEEG